MAEICSDLEFLGKQGTFNGAAELITKLEQEYHRVCQALIAEDANIRSSNDGLYTLSRRHAVHK